MFRLQENTPEIYTKGSRDFQLFCRIYDTMINSVHYNIKSTLMLMDPMQCNDRVLPLLATRVGFFPRSEYLTRLLRYVISSFSDMMKYKGSKKGIEVAVYTLLRAEEHTGEAKIDINSETATVSIYLSTPIENTALLQDILNYVMPIGYDLNIQMYNVGEDQTTQLSSLVVAEESKLTTSDLSKVVRLEDLNYPSNLLLQDNIGNVSSSEILPTNVGE